MFTVAGVIDLDVLLENINEDRKGCGAPIENLDTKSVEARRHGFVVKGKIDLDVLSKNIQSMHVGAPVPGFEVYLFLLQKYGVGERDER